MTANHKTGRKPTTKVADVITYRYEDKMVYVPLDSNWPVGLDRFLHFFVGSRDVRREHYDMHNPHMRHSQRLTENGFHSL